VCIYIAHVIYSKEGSAVLLFDLKPSGSAAGLCVRVRVYVCVFFVCAL